MRSKNTIKRSYVWLWVGLTACILIVGVVAALIFFGVLNPFDQRNDSDISSDALEVDGPVEPSVPVKLSSATILSTGDIMVHDPQLTGAKVPGKQEWDFSAFFKEIDTYYTAADFSVANLETTFATNEDQPYDGYPIFNTPDDLVDEIKTSGLDMVLTANNHCYDTGAKGFERTQKVLIENGISYVGTRLSEDAPRYVVHEVNGIKFGMISYTYETDRYKGLKTVNGIPVKEKDTNLLNSFNYENLDAFYTEVEEVLALMKGDGAEATIFYLHWGDEYKTTENKYQNKIAQALCDRGVDVIVGGHPHVIQPMELLTAEDGEHHTVCIYSLGNAVSNQRRERISSCPSGHTEDGILFYCTFDKYSDGKVILSDVDIIPTWVNKYPGGSGYQYTIYPLENANDGAEKYGLTGSAASKCQKSYQHTVEIVAKGLTACQKAIGCEITFPEENF